MDYKEIQELIKLVKKNSISELKIERDDFKINIKSQGDQKIIQQVAPAPIPMPVQQHAPAPAPAAATPSAPAPAPKEDTSNLVEVKSPMIGTFYRAAGPDKDPFVGIGDVIKKGDVVCMVEAMKLFNEIVSEVEGKIVKILVEDASPIEYDQPLFLVDPTA